MAAFRLRLKPEFWDDPCVVALTLVDMGRISLLESLLLLHGEDGVLHVPLAVVKRYLRFRTMERCEAWIAKMRDYRVLKPGCLAFRDWCYDSSMSLRSSQSPPLIERHRSPSDLPEATRERKQRSRADGNGVCEALEERKDQAVVTTPVTREEAAFLEDVTRDVTTPRIESRSNRIEEYINIDFESNESNRIETRTRAQTEAALLRSGILTQERAEILVNEHGIERCWDVIESLPFWKIKKSPGALIEYALANPDKYPCRPEVIEDRKRRAAQAARGVREHTEKEEIGRRVEAARATMTGEQRRAIREAAEAHLDGPMAHKLKECRQRGQLPSPLIESMIAQYERDLLLQSLRAEPGNGTG